MRIISGKARGTKLYTLEGQNTRPTLDRVKESLFNIIQNEIQGCIFLDLFSGSGAIGLEAVSRGAKKAILCDNSKEAINIIKKNIEKTHMQEQIELYQTSFTKLLKENIKEKIDIAYIDPPYDTNFVYEAVKIMTEKDMLTENSIIIVETDQGFFLHLSYIVATFGFVTILVLAFRCLNLETQFSLNNQINSSFIGCALLFAIMFSISPNFDFVYRLSICVLIAGLVFEIGRAHV